jgi:hypothetical protein
MLPSEGWCCYSSMQSILSQHKQNTLNAYYPFPHQLLNMLWSSFLDNLYNSASNHTSTGLVSHQFFEWNWPPTACPSDRPRHALPNSANLSCVPAWKKIVIVSVCILLTLFHPDFYNAMSFAVNFCKIPLQSMVCGRAIGPGAWWWHYCNIGKGYTYTTLWLLHCFRCYKHLHT